MATATQSRVLPSDAQVRPASLLLHHAPPLTTAASSLPLVLEAMPAQLLRGGTARPLDLKRWQLPMRNPAVLDS